MSEVSNRDYEKQPSMDTEGLNSFDLRTDIGRVFAEANLIASRASDHQAPKKEQVNELFRDDTQTE